MKDILLISSVAYPNQCQKNTDAIGLVGALVVIICVTKIQRVDVSYPWSYDFLMSVNLSSFLPCMTLVMLLAWGS